jgi:Holliday junction resolvasome RuvABC endonuclease subunit
MMIVNKEQMQELDQTIDERIVWEIISSSNEIKQALISKGHATKSNIETLFNEYIDLKTQEMQS